MRLPALLAVPIALVGLAVPASAEEPDLTITWPTATDIEVPSTSYTINVADTSADPQGTLYAEWQGEQYELPHSGDYTVDFTKGGTGTIKVVRCVPPTEPPGDPVCADTGDVSPELTVSKYLGLFLPYFDGTFGGGRSISYAVWPASDERYPGAGVSVDWQLLRADTAALAASGTGTTTLDGDGHGEMKLTIPDTVVSGRYELAAQMSAEIAPFGPYRTESSVELNIDSDPPTVNAGISRSTIYPYRDGYIDVVWARIRTNEWTNVRLDYINSSGKVARTTYSKQRIDHSVALNGRTASGALLPAGSYTVRMTVRDRVGNVSLVTRKLAVSHKRLVKKTWTRTFKAGATLTRNGAFVQACSTLRRPALRPWAGSLGYYSRTKCNRNNADIVSTTNGVYVPKAFQKRYGSYQVRYYGGRARSVRSAYIVMGYLNNKNNFTHRIQGGSAVRTYKGKVASAGNFVRAKTTKPYVLWTAGLTDGSRYDVKSFTVRLTYTVLA